MPVSGAIADRARAILPVTWDALSGDPRYGDGSLQTSIDTVKDSVFGEVVAPTAEAAYPLMAIDYAAKLVALELIPAGIDFWMNEPTSESATGTNENHTFDLRAARLAELRNILLQQTRGMAMDVANLIGYGRTTTNYPRNSAQNDEFLTPSPQEFPRPYSATSFS